MTKILPMTEVKAHLPELVTGVADRGDEIVITKHGRPAAILLNYEEYESLIETLDILSNKKSMAMFRRTGRFYARGGKGLTIEEVFGE